MILKTGLSLFSPGKCRCIEPIVLLQEHDRFVQGGHKGPQQCRSAKLSYRIQSTVKMQGKNSAPHSHKFLETNV